MKERKYKSRTFDVNNYYQMRNLAHSVGVSIEMLKEAIPTIGTSAHELRTHFKTHGRPVGMHRPNINGWRL